MKNTLAALTGMALLAVVLSRIGWASMIPQLQAVWMAVPLVIILSLLRLMLQTSAWAIALRAEGVSVSTPELIGMRLASQGMGYLTPLGAAVSEPMKIQLLGGRTERAATGTLVDTGTYWISSAAFGALACLAGAAMTHGSKRVSFAVLGAVMTGFLILVTRSRAVLPALARKLGSRCPAWLKKGEGVEAMIRTFGERHPGRLIRMFWLGTGCQVVLAAEVATVFWALRIPFDAGVILALEAANRGLKILTGWLPGRVGADEGGTAGTFVALGLSPASGVALALTRRTRDLLACAFGLCWLAWTKTRKGVSQCAH